METYLTFLIGHEYFAVHVSMVLEVLQKQNITTIPKTPAHILGIINFRGDIVPVIDLRSKFNLNSNKISEKYIVIVFEIPTEEGIKNIISAKADAVKDVIQINPKEIKQVPELGLNFNSQFINGAIKRDDIFILLLDIEKVFNTNDLLVSDLVINDK